MNAKIAVAAANFGFDKAFSYVIPPSMTDTALPGVRVMVPFGRSNRRTEGIILAREEGGTEGLKLIDQLLDEQPVLTDEQLRLAAFLRQRYFCTMYDAVRAMLPSGLLFQAREEYRLCGVMSSTDIEQHPDYFTMTEAIADLGGVVTQDQLSRLYSTAFLEEALPWLKKKKLLLSSRDFLRRGAEKTERIAALAVSTEEALDYTARSRKRSPLQCAVLEMLVAVGTSSVKELCYFTGASTQTVNRLEKMGYLVTSTQEVLRRPEIQAATAQPIELAPEQRMAYEGLLEQQAREKPGVALLYGVTGSGKTSVYLELIRKTLAAGKSAMLLVPEISLTPQMLSLFAGHFGSEVAVLHSSLRSGERYDEYRRIRDGQAHLVIGTRSAIFAPMQNPGLLILDEEQEHTYKSENAPRYSAREVAIYRGACSNALVVLGSATPSIETMYHAQCGDYGFYTLKTRYNGRALPKVTIADLKEDLRGGNGTAIGAVLRHELEDNLAEGRQSILFLNRRGNARLLQCMECGEAPPCPRCSVSLTYHSANGRVMCHYCGYSARAPQRCTCGGLLRPVGAGTQRVQEELAELFPGIEVLRMDADTVSAVNTHQKLFARFENERIPILLGTQMVTKGLNFENVTLVGVLDADMSLHVGTYRAAENTFSMLAQVIGRSGRGQHSGRAVIQTLTPENEVLQLAAEQDYDRFYQQEIRLRQLRGCPPFQDQLILRLSGMDETAVREAAFRCRDRLAEQFRQWMDPVQILGPAPEPVVRVNLRYRYQLTISARNSRALRALLADEMVQFSNDRANRGVTIYADVNPCD